MFNALKYTQELQNAGFSREQAETSMKVLIEVMNDNFTTKSDLKELEVAMKSDLKVTEAAMRSDMKEMESGIRSDMKEMETGIRSDMKEMETGIRSDMNKMETGLRSEIREMDYRLTIKLGTMLIGSVGLMVTLMKFLSLKA